MRSQSLPSQRLDRVFGALADPTRREILTALQKDDTPVHVLASMFDMSRPAVSKHLAVLRAAGLVREARSGRENFYALDRDNLAEAQSWLTVFWRSRLGSLKKLVEGKHGRRSRTAADL
jgi:DNA-binding transcriptional ArsR family regulator